MDAPTRTTDARLTHRLVLAGMLAGPLYLVTGYAQALTRDGFDVRRHALSLLSNGDLGWIQTANFVVSGLLVIAGAAGIRRAIRGRRGGTWGPILLAIYGVGLLGAGAFAADPGAGFPPGTPVPEAMTRTGVLHFAFGGLGFYALIAATFVFARRFGAGERRWWAVCSVATGVLFLVSFGVIASGSTSPRAMLAFYAAVTWIWIWHSAVHASVWADASGAGTPT